MCAPVLLSFDGLGTIPGTPETAREAGLCMLKIALWIQRWEDLLNAIPNSSVSRT